MGESSMRLSERFDVRGAARQLEQLYRLIAVSGN